MELRIPARISGRALLAWQDRRGCQIVSQEHRLRPLRLPRQVHVPRPGCRDPAIFPPARRLQEVLVIIILQLFVGFRDPAIFPSATFRRVMCAITRDMRHLGGCAPLPARAIIRAIAHYSCRYAITHYRRITPRHVGADRLVRVPVPRAMPPLDPATWIPLHAGGTMTPSPAPCRACEFASLRGSCSLRLASPVVLKPHTRSPRPDAAV